MKLPVCCFSLFVFNWTTGDKTHTWLVREAVKAQALMYVFVCLCVGFCVWT